MRKLVVLPVAAALMTLSLPSIQAVFPAAAASAATKAVVAAKAVTGSPVPHYFGPTPNYANSPLRMSDAVVDFSGGTGSGAAAVATVDPATGAIKSFNVTDGGSGYQSAPDVAITSPLANGSGAAATATIARGVTSIAVVNGGAGYTAPPAITITGDGTGATATPNMSGFIGSVVVGLGGSGYVNPTITFELPETPGGIPAAGTATVVNCELTGITITNRGSGYLTEPNVAIVENGVQTGGAAVRALVTMDTIQSIDMADTGSGYTHAAVTIDPPTDTAGTQATVTPVVSGAVTDVTVTSPGSGYVTPGGIQKFVDTLPGLGAANKNDLGQYIPVATPDTTTYPGADYYEIAVVQYREKMHRDVPATLLRGYVQLSTTVTPGAHVALTNANLDPTVADAPITLNGQPVYGVDKPHSYGPLIQATKDRAVRVLFRNLLPTGVAGDLFLPVDSTVMGSGGGPAMGSMAEPDPQNPMCNDSPKPAGCYTENRAIMHLHGGITPWISDGTPHQWTTPAGENATYPKGVSATNVPDMPDPGPGAETFFYTNQQSARLMFYHDHSYGITRLNVYAGEAAGYTITDSTEKALVASGTVPQDSMPLILADKTFVPSANQLATEDPTWNTAKWGGEGNLWMPHVYMPIQNPGDSTGQSPVGRWQYGPWFWPPTAGITYGPKANPYYNATCDSQDPLTPFCEPKLMPGTPNISMGMESYNDTPTVNGTAYPTTTLQPKSYRFRVLNAADDRYFNLQLYKADPTTGGTEVALDAAAVAAEQTDPTVVPTPDLKKSPAGPNFIQIGNEGGFLPAPVVVPNQPITWVTDVGRFDAGNVDKHALLVGPAERADVIVDFSKYAGQTLILYNDAPAAFPARDPRYDYHTGDADLTASGGAPSTLPGYGPNTRTVMQIKIAAAPVAVPFNYNRLVTAFAHHTDGSGVFESSQNPIIVGQGAYNSAYGTGFRTLAPNDGFVRINDASLSFKTLAGIAPTAVNPDPKVPDLTMPLQFKALHDEQGASFDATYGRMSGNLGLEDPAALANAQNIYLYPYINPATETFKGITLPPGVSVTPISTATDGTEIWKITHNGVDTHTLHWHLYDVQVLNRTGWDGIIRAPDPTELGWKETVRVSPLEDTFVAMRPIIPKLPFGVPDSVRLLDPTMPAGSTVGFNQAGPGGAALGIVNQKVNMGWEYVWHCHLLSHEEMDMMRPVDVTVATTKAAAPVLTQVGSTAAFNWTDGTRVGNTIATWGDPANEIGFRLERANVVNNVVGPYAVIGTTLANKTGLTDPSPVLGKTYSYRAVAYNTSGDSFSNLLRVSYGASALSGTVTANGTPVASATVTAYTLAGVNVLSSTTNNAGNYSLALVPGSYKLYIQSPVTGYPNQWYGGASQATATAIPFSAAAVQNIVLAGTPSYALSGVATLILGPSPGAKSGVKINVYNAATGASLTSVTTNGGGGYSVTLAAGTYKLYLQPNRNGYANQWFGGTSIATATVITVNAAMTLAIPVHT